MIRDKTQFVVYEKLIHKIVVTITEPLRKEIFPRKSSGRKYALHEVHNSQNLEELKMNTEDAHQWLTKLQIGSWKKVKPNVKCFIYD